MRPLPVSESGFTLIELLITISIIAILAALFMPFIVSIQKRSYDAGAQMCAKSIRMAQEIYHLEHLAYSIIGNQAGNINRNSEGIEIFCTNPDIFLVDRSDPSKMKSMYLFDIWNRRGMTVYTIDARQLSANMPGATLFSSSGAGGANLP